MDLKIYKLLIVIFARSHKILQNLGQYYIQFSFRRFHSKKYIRNYPDTNFEWSENH